MTTRCADGGSSIGPAGSTDVGDYRSNSPANPGLGCIQAGADRLTGLWQIKGRKDLPICENLRYDFYYIRHRSLALDIAIILRTIPLILRGRGI